MGETFDEKFVLGIIRELSEGIGPRLGGSEASHRAADYLADLLGGMGLDVRMQAFSYLGWEYDQMPEISLTAPVDEKLDSQPMAFTLASSGPIEGTVWRDGVVPAIPGVFEFARLAVGEEGERRAAMFVPPQDGPAFALPSIDLMFTEPGLYIPKADGDRILAWLDDGKEVRVRLETFGRHVSGFTDSNVIARLPGELEERIVVSSHYDTAWKAPGAMDNASGVAAMAEVARRMKERGTQHTFEFIAFAAEEWFLFGSEFFVAEASYRGEIGQYRGVVNCDPLGPGNTLSVWVGPDSEGTRRPGHRRPGRARPVRGRLHRPPYGIRSLSLLDARSSGLFSDLRTGATRVPSAERHDGDRRPGEDPHHRRRGRRSCTGARPPARS